MLFPIYLLFLSSMVEQWCFTPAAAVVWCLCPVSCCTSRTRFRLSAGAWQSSAPQGAESRFVGLFFELLSDNQWLDSSLFLKGCISAM